MTSTETDALRALSFAHDAETLGDLCIGFDPAAPRTLHAPGVGGALDVTFDDS